MQYLFDFNLKDIEIVHSDDFMKAIMEIVSVYRNDDSKYTTSEAIQLFEKTVEYLKSLFYDSLRKHNNVFQEVSIKNFDMTFYKDFKFRINTINEENGEFEENVVSLVDYLGEDETVKIPNGVEKIDRCCFYHNKRINTVYIPSSVKYISDKAFIGCTNLKKIYTKNSFDSNMVSNCNEAEIVQLL